MAFYQCPKCKKVWQYPIERCPECFLGLERLKSEKTKVIGVSKVNLPTILHPQVPYFVLVLEDENGNRWAQKSVREYQIGDELEIEKAEKKQGVAIWRVKYDFLEAIEKLVEILGESELKENTRVLILPALFSASHSYFKDNTSPEFLEAVLRFLFEKRVRSENIKVVGQSFDEVPVGAKAQKSGLLEVCQKNKVLSLDLATTDFVKRGNLEISEEVFKSDFILNLPILKMGKAAASENLFFLLKKENYLAQKYLFSEKEIFENLSQVLSSNLTLAEADVIQDLEKFTNFLGLAMASYNPLSLDRIFFEITKKREELPEILKEVKIEEIPIFGRKVEELQYEVERF